MNEAAGSQSTSPRIEELAPTGNDDDADSYGSYDSYDYTASTTSSSAAAAAAAAAEDPPYSTSYANVYPFNPSNPYTPPTMLPPAPELYTSQPAIRDPLVTRTSKMQDETVAKVLPLLSNRENPLPRLNRTAHVKYLESGLSRTLPDYMVMLDASRPWIIYWCLGSLATLGVDVSQYEERVMNTFTPIQNDYGGFGGGNGQYSHLAGTYAAVLSLLTVSPRCLSLVNKPRMLSWLHRLKNADGSFSVCEGGETDVRGVYCALTTISLLQLPTSNGLLANTIEYLLACQTYEGGFAATPGGSEAHGGYAFCALAALAILLPPAEWGRRIDMDSLLRWLSARQYAPEGGLSGRTNKLVDGCYSTWVGGCWALVEAAVNALAATPEQRLTGPLWDREGLVRYIMCTTQSTRGGLRDKPGLSPDYYHTLYVLLGLSSAQHYFYYQEPEEKREKEGGKEGEEGDGGLPPMTPFYWHVSPGIPGVESIVRGWPGWPDSRKPGDADEEGEAGASGEWVDDDEGDRVGPQHPIFNVPIERIGELVESWRSG